MKHNSIALLKSIPPIRRTLSAFSIVLSLVFALAAFGVEVGTSFTYQGQLRRNGAAYNGTCNFQFSLWDAVSGGTQQSTTQSINSVNVANGLFTVVLDFGDVLSGDAHWLATSVQCSGDGGFTALDPRQYITATPYALSLRPGAKISGAIFDAILRVDNSESSGYGIIADSPGTGVVGSGHTGVYGVGGGPGSIGVHGVSDEGFAGRFFGEVKIDGAVSATANSTAITGTGVWGVQGVTTSNSGTGVWGQATGPNSAGVYGSNRDFAGVWGHSSGAGPAIFGESISTGYAGYFRGSVVVEGTLSKGAGSFRIDHPLDPANKFLSHSFVESPDMMNIYNGNVTTDASGSATVTLPDYFAALNRDFRYQLTVLGQFAQAIVSREIAQNSFEIRTDKPGVKVSWQVTGIRQDVYAKANPIVVEEFKPAEQKGLYLYPAGFGAGEDKRIGPSSLPATAPDPQDAPAAGSDDQAPSK